MLTRRIALSVIVLCWSASLVRADERLKGIACRSVHLQYSLADAALFYNEVTVEKSAEGTYFCVCGFSKGYFGIQELANGKKLVIFSVWDTGNQNDPKSVAEEKRVKLLHQGEGVRIGRFGNEGTGGQSFFDFDWKIGATYRFLVAAKPDGKERTAFAGYIHLPDKNEWKHLVTFSTITGGKLLSGGYSFVEDFRRNKVSATKERRAAFGNGWALVNGKWQPLVKSRFTADANPVLNIDAGAIKDRFFLATGGDIENKTTKLNESMVREAGPAKPPGGLPVTGD